MSNLEFILYILIQLVVCFTSLKMHFSNSNYMEERIWKLGYDGRLYWNQNKGWRNFWGIEV